MTPSPDPDKGLAIDPRIRFMMVLAIIAVALSLLQQTPFAPLPHAMDGFLGGVAIGLGIGSLIALFASSQT
jgi:predicted lipid-binding transport protein (Tim44 family)